MKKFIAEFKEFAMKGNVVDMAIGVVIGAAFGKITTSLVNDVIMPLISRITGGVDFSAWKWVLKAAEVDETGAETAAEIAVNYGSFIAVVLDFLIIALVFVFIGTLASNDLVWELTDMFNNLMVIPNAIALFALTGMVVAMCKEGKLAKKK